MRLRRWFWTAVIALSLVATPVMVGTSLFNAGYGFAEQLETTTGPFTWAKNPVGKQIKHYATGVETDIYHLTENVHHWDLAGEIVLDWEHHIVFPFGYFYDIIADNYKIVLSPTNEMDTEDGDTFILGRVDTEGAAKIAVVMLWAKMKGMQFNLEPDKQAPLREASL